MAKPTVNELTAKLLGRVPYASTLKEFESNVLRFLQKEDLTDAERKDLASKIASFGPLSKLMDQPDVEDIMVNSLNPIFIFDSKKGMVKTDTQLTPIELEEFIQKLLLFSGKTRICEINDLNIPGGARANVVISPFGPQITIRRFRQTPCSILDLVDMGMLNYEVAAELWLYTEGMGVKPANMLLTGGPASGKTTLLNALFSFFPDGQRVVVIEDTLELNTATAENCSRLITREGTDLEALVKNSLRMRPDRIIVGEVRGEEARDMITAMNIGRICMGTIHAGSAREAVTRLEREPMNIQVSSIPLIDVVVSTGRYVQEGEQFRRITGVSEIAGIESGKIQLCDRYEFDYNARKIVEKSPSVTYRDRLAKAAGVSPNDIMFEVEKRKIILQRLKRKGITTVDQMSKFCKGYYENPATALKSVGISVEDK